MIIVGKKLGLLIFWCWCCFLAPPVLGAEFPLPPAPQSNIYVQDLANVLSPETEQSIIRLGEQLQAKTGAQAVVVTVPNLADRPIEEYSLELFRAWGIGHKDKNNGVLLLVAPAERKSRIEVGYGLEGALPDALTGRIQDEYMIPYFAKENYDQGVWQGYQATSAQVAKEANVDLGIADTLQEPVRKTAQATGVPWWLPFVVIGLLILDFVFLGGFVSRSLFQLLVWSFIFRGGGRGGGGFGGGGGGFGGGSSGGGGSSRSW